MTRISRFLSLRRDAASLSTAKVHRELNARGVNLTYPAVFRWFTGEHRPDIGQIYVLGLVLGFSGVDLLHALRLAAEDAAIGETPTPFEPDPTVVPVAEAA